MAPASGSGGGDDGPAGERARGGEGLPADFDLVLASMKTALVRLAEDGAVRYANVAAEHLFGTSQAKLAGAPLARVLAHDTLTALITQALRNRRTYMFRELRLEPRSVTTGPSLVDCHMTPLEVDHRPAGLLLELQDAEARLRFDRDAAQSVQLGASRTMTRQLAHEIKNPLGGIRGAAQLLERRLPEGDREYTGVIMRETDRLTTLVDSMLGPATEPRPVRLNIHELLFDVERLVSAEAPPGVTVRADYDPSLPLVLVDPDDVIQALLNIARNALQALGGSGRILLRTRSASQTVVREGHRSNMVRVDVEDDGPGVPEALRHTLFYPLVTGRSAGSGLGLPTAQELVNRQGGSIEYESQAGRTVFSILLPVEADTP